MQRCERLKQDFIRDAKLLSNVCKDFWSIFNNFHLVISKDIIDTQFIILFHKFKNINCVLNIFQFHFFYSSRTTMIRCYNLWLCHLLEKRTHSHQDNIDQVETGLQHQSRLLFENVWIVSCFEFLVSHLHIKFLSCYLLLLLFLLFFLSFLEFFFIRDKTFYNLIIAIFVLSSILVLQDILWKK